MPTNGTDSLHKLTGVGANSPTNYAGATGSVDANPSPPIPLASPAALMALFGMIGAGGFVALRRRTARGA